MSALVLPTPQQVSAAFGVIEPPPIQIDCDQFQGSLATLFVLVREHKIDLMGIPLGPICEAYFRYLLESTEPCVESHAVAVAALSRLLDKKAALLIAPPAEEECEEDQLFDDFEPTIHEFMPAIEDLLGRKSERESLYFRAAGAAENYELPFEADSITTLDLARALERLLAKAKPDPPRPLATRRSLSDQIAIVLRALPEEPLPLDQIVDTEFTRSEAVWWFLALLELIRLGQARVVIAEGEACFGRPASA